jgi:glyoxylase-like metal-dependent hydrolase (beta-lactamase superfamily II)
MFSPVSATLISGERDAVLVDTLMTLEQTKALGDWIAATGKNLTSIYLTHGHGDHVFGIGSLQKRFPGARAFALPPVIEFMRRQLEPESLDSWKRRFPRQIPDDLGTAEPLAEGGLQLEGHDLVPVYLGHTDTDDTTCLHVSSIGLVVAGDAAYNDVHLLLSHSNPELRREWIAALDTIESLGPKAVIAGHKRAERADDPVIIEETRQYIRDFDRLAEATSTAQELFGQMLQLYPDRINPGALWTSVLAVKPESRKGESK